MMAGTQSDCGGLNPTTTTKSNDLKYILDFKLYKTANLQMVFLRIRLHNQRKHPHHLYNCNLVEEEEETLLTIKNTVKKSWR